MRLSPIRSLLITLINTSPSCTESQWCSISTYAYSYRTITRGPRIFFTASHDSLDHHEQILFCGCTFRCACSTWPESPRGAEYPGRHFCLGSGRGLSVLCFLLSIGLWFAMLKTSFSLINIMSRGSRKIWGVNQKSVWLLEFHPNQNHQYHTRQRMSRKKKLRWIRFSHPMDSSTSMSWTRLRLKPAK